MIPVKKPGRNKLICQVKIVKTVPIIGILIPALSFLLITSNIRAAADINPGTDTAEDHARDTDPGNDIEELSDDTLIKAPEKREDLQHYNEKQDEGKARKIRLTFFDPSSREYVALFVGYGGYFPVADYGTVYKPGHQVSFTAGIYYINFLGLSPEVHVRYATMDYRNDPLRYSASLSQVQAYPAIVYRYPIKLPRNTLTVYGRVWDGLSRIYYESRDPYLPMMKRNIVENLNIFGLSAGCYYDAWKGLLVGVDVSYSLVSTARKPLQSVSFMLNVGWRIL